MFMQSISSDRTESQTNRAAQQVEPSFFNSTRKTVGVAGAIFFALGAVVMDPILLIPASLCAVLACGWGCLDLFSKICSALTPSYEPVRGIPQQRVTPLVVVRDTTPTYYSAPSVQTVYTPAPASVHTMRSDGHARVPQHQQTVSTRITPEDVGLHRTHGPSSNMIPVSQAQSGRPVAPPPRNMIPVSQSQSGRSLAPTPSSMIPVRKPQSGRPVAPPPSNMIPVSQPQSEVHIARPTASPPQTSPTRFTLQDVGLERRATPPVAPPPSNMIPVSQPQGEVHVTRPTG